MYNPVYRGDRVLHSGGMRRGQHWNEMVSQSNEGYEKAYPMSTLRAPSGVTNIGGANVYAAKLATTKMCA